LFPFFLIMFCLFFLFLLKHYKLCMAHVGDMICCWQHYRMLMQKSVSRASLDRTAGIAAGCVQATRVAEVTMVPAGQA
jgi:hypothetical protein